MEQRITQLEEKLLESMNREVALLASMKGLAEGVQNLHKLHMEMLQRSLRHQSMMKSMTSILAELCALEGMEAESFLDHLNARASYFHDETLTNIETDSPGMAAGFDDRTEAEIPDFDMFPPLFLPAEDEEEEDGEGDDDEDDSNPVK
jgi:hypothetical protein